MNYASIKHFDTSDGPGIRTSLFVSGCHWHCKGCFNSIAWDKNYGKEFTKETEDAIIESLKPDYVDGLSLLGGEPFEPYNIPALIHLCKRVRKELPTKTIWCWTGGEMMCHYYDALELLELLDVLVDGQFIEEKKNLNLKFKGSTNQRVIDVQKSLSEKRIILLDKYNDQAAEKPSFYFTVIDSSSFGVYTINDIGERVHYGNL